MKYKTKILGLSLLAMTLCVSLALGAYYSYRGGESRSARLLESFLKTGTLNELLFSGGEKGVRLKAEPAGKASRNWSVIINEEKYPAAREKAEHFLELALGVSLLPPITENEDKWKLFGLEDTVKTRIRFSGPGGTTEILLGKDEETGRGQYIRFAGTKAVYLASISLSYYAERDASYWSDLRVFPASLKTQDIVAMSASGLVSWEIIRERKEGGLLWEAQGTPVIKLDQGKVDSIAAALSQINAKSFAGEAEKEGAGIDSGQAVFTLTAAGKTRYELRLGRADKDGNRYAQARVNGEPLPHLYSIDAYTLGKIVLPRGDLAAAP